LKHPTIPSGKAPQIPPTTTSSVIVTPKPRSKSKYVWVAALVIVLAILTLFLWPEKSVSSGSVVWLTPAEATKAFQRGKLTNLKFKLLRMSRHASNWYMKKRTQIMIESRLMNVSDEASLLGQLPPQSFKNADGMRAWILPPEEWANFKQRLTGSAQEVSTLSSSRITTLDDSQAIASSGTAFTNTTVNVFPAIAGGYFDLLLGAASTITVTSPTTFSTGTLTNFAMACRVVLPNGGALVVDGRKRGDAPGTNYWFITSAVAVDPAGNPKKL